MIIGIIGYGVVGKATAHAFIKHGHTILSYDTKKCGENWEIILSDTEIVFVCTPENTVPRIVSELAASQYQGYVVIRSTVPPGTTKHLSRFTEKIAHNPEFLRERFSLEDASNPHIIVIGTDDNGTASLLSELYAPFRHPIFVLHPIESEMLKLWWNAKLACQVSFGNEMKEVCDKVGANAHLLNNIVSQFPLYTDHPWMIGKPFDGKCLPKDLDQLIACANEHGTQTVLLHAIRDANEQTHIIPLLVGGE